MDKKILSVTYPKSLTWQWNSTIFSILDENEYGKEWLFSHFIQLKAKVNQENNLLFTDYDTFKYVFDSCPYLCIQPIADHEIHEAATDVADWIVKRINNEQYVFGIFDEGMLVQQNQYRKQLHELFIYGYDLSLKLFFVGDFTFTHSGKYSFEKIPFENIVSGYHNVHNHEDSVFHEYLFNHRGLITLRPDVSRRKYRFDKLYVIEQLYNYLDSKSVLHDNATPAYEIIFDHFGLDVYNGLREVIDHNQKNREAPFDTRSVQVIYDHKVLSTIRAKYFMANKIIEEDQSMTDMFMELENSVFIFRNKYIKLGMSYKTEGIVELIKQIDTIKKLEEKCLHRLILKLEGGN